MSGEVPYHVTYPVMPLMLPTPALPTDACENITSPKFRLRAVMRSSFVCYTGSPYNEFCYNGHPVTISKYFCIKIIAKNVKSSVTTSINLERAVLFAAFYLLYARPSVL